MKNRGYSNAENKFCTEEISAWKKFYEVKKYVKEKLYSRYIKYAIDKITLLKKQRIQKGKKDNLQGRNTWKKSFIWRKQML